MSIDMLITVGSVGLSILMWAWTQGKAAAARDVKLASIVSALGAVDTDVRALGASVDEVGDRLMRLEMILLRQSIPQLPARGSDVSHF